jgi:hypothetical protein
METNYRGAGLKVLNDQAVAECRVYPATWKRASAVWQRLRSRVGPQLRIIAVTDGFRGRRLLRILDPSC